MGRAKKEELCRYRIFWILNNPSSELFKGHFIMDDKLKLFQLALKILDEDKHLLDTVKGFLVEKEI